MNTDQAFNLLMDAGVTESICIQTVRRLLREGKIKYKGAGDRKTGYIIDDADQAFDLLKAAGVSEGTSIQTVRRWLCEGKIKYKTAGNRKTGYIIDDTAPKLFINNHTNQNKDEIIRQLKLKIKTQDEHIEGIQELHESATKVFIQQRDKLNEEIIMLINEKSNLQNETMDLLKEIIELRDELIKLKENKSDNYFHSTTQSNDYSQKLGLSKMASNKEVLAGYKELLKITHPDSGGNAKSFHYIKTEYENFRNSIKD